MDPVLVWDLDQDSLAHDLAIVSCIKKRLSLKIDKDKIFDAETGVKMIA